MATTTQPQSNTGDELAPRQRPEIVEWLAQLDWQPYALIAFLQILTGSVFLANSSSGAPSWLDKLPLDDAWVHMVYARSFAEHAQLWYNPGVPESGITSPMWAVVLGSVWTVLGVFGVGIVATAKLLGLALAIGTGWLTMHVAWRLTRQRRLGILAGALVAIEPSFAFAAMSGMEIQLFSLLSLAAVWTFLQGRLRTTGVLFALVVLTRPEGYAIFGIVLATTIARRMWQRDRLELVNNEDLREIVSIVAPTLILGGAWAAYNYVNNGSAWPNSYLVSNVDMGLIPAGNIVNSMQGYYHQLSFFSGVAYPITFIAILVGAISVMRTFSFSGAPLALLPIGLTYAVTTSFPVSENAWNFFTRRYLDGVVPVLTILMILGFMKIWQQFHYWRETRAPIDQREAHIFNFGLNLVFVAAVLLPFVALPANWQRLSSDYSWNSKNVHDIDVGMAHWVNENLPEDARIGVSDAGAMRFFGNRYTYDLSGRNTASAIGKQPLTFAEEKKIDYVIAYRSIYFDSWQFADPIHFIEVDRNTILGGSRMVAYDADYVEEIVFADATIPIDDDILDRAISVIDIVDPGNGESLPQYSEAAHAYELQGAGSVVERSFRTVISGIVNDEATTFRISEEFIVKSVPDELLVIAKRYDAAIGGTVRVFANDREVGIWELADKDFFFGVDSFDIPAEFVTGDKTTLRFDHIPEPGRESGNSFMWWIFVENSVAEESGIEIIDLGSSSENPDQASTSTQ